MKPASEWTSQFLNKHVLNVRGNEFEELIKAVQEDAAKELWERIETAPKDGTRILLYQPGDEGGSFIGKNETGYRFVGCFDKENWYCTEYTAFTKTPTHWMPLPGAPS
jgi:hypothetical protein